MYYNILVARPFDQVFTYESDDQTLEVGQIVIVPFGKAMEVGMIMQADVSKPDYTIKKIETVINGIQLKEFPINTHQVFGKSLIFIPAGIYLLGPIP